MIYATAVAAVASALSFSALALLSLARGDEGGWGRYLWELIVLPITLCLGMLSLPAYDVVQRLGGGMRRLLLGVMNAALVAAGGWLGAIGVAWVLS